MTTPTDSSNPLYSGYNNASQRNGAAPMDGSLSRMAIDNLIRRELRVSDPKDSQQIAQALLARYKDDPRAVGITREAQGLPFLQTAPMPMVATQAVTSNDLDLQQAVSDIDRDLQELTSNTALKDITPELQGWSAGIRSAIAEGVASARFALDARQRDKTLGIRRTLGDYARMARLVGTLTPTRNINFRNLAQSLDEAASVFLVMMGEALANGGVSGGRFLLQVPYSELQVRRDTAIFALRNLTGSTQESYAPNEWPRGLDAYRKLFNELDSQGQGDLRSLLVENELARTIDALIHRAAHGTADGLRALGATAQLDLERFRRIIIVGYNMRDEFKSPPLAAFLDALRLFVDAFGTGETSASGGYRLLRIARPPILFYGLYGSSGLDNAEQRLLQLVISRNKLADQLDGIVQFSLPAQVARVQVLLDKILYDVDRAIDLYAVGTDDFGDPEQRAATYHYIIRAFFHYLFYRKYGGQREGFSSTLDQLASQITFNRDEILQGSSPDDVSVVGRLNNEFAVALNTIGLTLREIQESLIPQGLRRNEGTIPGSKVFDSNQLSNRENLDQTFTLLEFRRLVNQELFIQKDAENRWKNLVRSMTPSAVPYSSSEAGLSIFNEVTQMIRKAEELTKEIESVSDPKFSDDISLPANYEDSLQIIANKP